MRAQNSPHLPHHTPPGPERCRLPNLTRCEMVFAETVRFAGILFNFLTPRPFREWEFAGRLYKRAVRFLGITI